MAIPLNALGHHAEEVITREIREPEYFFGFHSELFANLLNGLALVQQPLYDGFHRFEQMRMGKVEKELHSADISGWKRFTIGSLFEIEKGTRLTRAAMIDGDTPFIGATLENNGITARVGNTGHVHPGGLMTVAYNGQKATGKAFYQPIPFWASDDVNVLYPKFSLTENIALFLAPLFWEAGRPYSFGDKWGKDVMENDCLVLPVNASSDPDWAYVDEYMRDVMERAQSDLSTMQSIG